MSAIGNGLKAEQQKDAEISKEKMDELKKTFKHFDRDGDNTISVDELTTAMRLMNMNPTEEEVKAIIKETDTDESGKIDFEEFVKFMTDRMNTVDEHDSLVQAFKTFDKDGNGFLDKEELKAILKEEGDIDDLMKVIDTNGDGLIDFEEFVAMMTE
ncbi:calmodulin-A-like [Mizuhopecten yessoensis]|uniref:calmodulin-A-like n=1 Tax=Mizuhopecten yessoensis TaxID=6573 RepID=UPI000B459729|nr:calmodulin-A-like [Mizuhopecten yessoensis]